MSEVLTPGPGQTVITTDEGYGHRGHGHHESHDDAIVRFNEALIREQAAGFRAAAADRVGLGNEITTASNAARAAACQTDRLIADLSKDTALAACKTDDTIAGLGKEVSTGFSYAQKQTSDAATATVVGFKDAQATAYQIEGRAGLTAERIGNQLSVQATNYSNLASVQATNNYNMLTVQAEKIAAAAALDAQKYAAAAILDSTKNAAAIAAQLAECCCELREKITADGDMTRSLINNNTIQELRDRLAATTRLVPTTLPVGT